MKRFELLPFHHQSSTQGRLSMKRIANLGRESTKAESQRPGEPEPDSSSWRTFRRNRTRPRPENRMEDGRQLISPRKPKFCTYKLRTDSDKQTTTPNRNRKDTTSRGIIEALNKGGLCSGTQSKLQLSHRTFSRISHIKRGNFFDLRSGAA